MHTISIIPTGMGAAGYTMPLPEKDRMFNTKTRMLNEIKVTLGGRIAEEIVFGDISTGASGDIKQVTKLAKSMVMKYGMSDKLGMINYESEHEEIFIGRDIGHTTVRRPSEREAGTVRARVFRRPLILGGCLAEYHAAVDNQ